MSKKNPVVKNAAKVPAKNAARVALDGAGPVTITVDDGKIQELAYGISQQPKTWDEFVWLFAEIELRLAPAYVVGSIFKSCVPIRVVQLYPGKIVEKPEEDDVRKMADQIAAQGPSLQDLHWFIAERNYVYNEAKTKM